MPQFYKIVKKNTAAHREALASIEVRNEAVISVDPTHVLVPSSRPVDVGFNVSHAKNRTIRRRLPNLRSMNIEINGANKTVQLTAHDLRTYKKLTQ